MHRQKARGRRVLSTLYDRVDSEAREAVVCPRASRCRKSFWPVGDSFRYAFVAAAMPSPKVGEEVRKGHVPIGGGRGAEDEEEAGSEAGVRGCTAT